MADQNDAGRWRSIARLALIVGAVGVVVALLGLVVAGNEFMPAYLFAYVFWIGLSLGLLAIAALHHLVRGTWGFPIQRLAESGARTLPLMALLFLPLVIGLNRLYPWTRPEVLADNAFVAAKTAYLNVPFFLARAAIYFAIWLFLAYRLSGLSLALDRTGDGRHIASLRRLSAFGVLAIWFTMTFAAIDWVMSLEPDWFSSIYGGMVAIGMVLSAWAAVTALVIWLARRPPIATAVSRRTFNDLGSLLLAFVILWAYFSFSQYMLIWGSNISEEVPWYVRRLNGGWQFVAIAILLLHFALPAALLIFRDVKRHGAMLAGVALFVLVMRVIDTFWLVAPAFHPGDFAVSWVHIATFIGIGGLWVALFAWNLGQRSLLPAVYPAPLVDTGGIAPSPHAGRQEGSR